MVHPGGRPRTVSPSPEECIKLGEDLVKWATEPTSEFRCLVGQWYSLKHGMTRSDWKTLIQRSEFVPYYNQAMQALAVKAIDGTMEKSFGHRYIRLYDRELIESENEQAKIDADLKKSELQQPQKVVFEVNYKNDSDNPVEISSKTLPTSDTKSAE